jgi:hypothetical protein
MSIRRCPYKTAATSASTTIAKCIYFIFFFTHMITIWDPVTVRIDVVYTTATNSRLGFIGIEGTSVITIAYPVSIRIT